MSKNRQYRRDLTKYQTEHIKYQYTLLLKSKGFLSTNQKKWLLGLKKKARQTDESDDWYKIRHKAKLSLLDLQLIAEIVDTEQLTDIFEPFTLEDHKHMDKTKGQFKRTDLNSLLSRILFPNNKANENDVFGYQLASQLVILGLNYLSYRPEFRRNLYHRLFQDVLDALNPYYT